jgi:hypothetical protein
MPKTMQKMLATTIAGMRATTTAGTGRDEDEMIQIGAVEESEHWTLTPASKWRKGKVQPAATGKDSDEIQIQALTDSSFKKVCVDSGAGESVCPVDAFPSYKTVETAKTGATYRAAGGQKLKNVGEIRPSFKSSGVGGSMAFQATTEVQKPLAAASKITAKGNRIVLEADGLDSYIEHKQSGRRIPLTVENGVYMMEMLVVPFQGPTK